MRRGVAWISLVVAAAGCGRSAFVDDGAAMPIPSGTLSPTNTTSATPTPETITLIDEKFDAGSTGLQQQTQVVWSDNSDPGFEVYDAGGAGARGMLGIYDDDGNPNTAPVSIPGGIEINDTASAVLLTAKLTLPPLTGSKSYIGGELTLWAGLRGAPAGSQTIEVFDQTANATITGAFVPVMSNATAPRPWTFNARLVPFRNTHSGHTIVVRFQGAGNGAEGLEMAHVTLTALRSP